MRVASTAAALATRKEMLQSIQESSWLPEIPFKTARNFR
jgi:hypothetical protein